MKLRVRLQDRVSLQKYLVCFGQYSKNFIVFCSELHISVNLCVQILLGIPLEMVHRWWRILIIYVAGVLSGSLFTSIIDPDVYLAGASGGVYSLLAAHIATIIMVRQRIPTSRIFEKICDTSILCWKPSSLFMKHRLFV